jgi:hypothetical protein
VDECGWINQRIDGLVDGLGDIDAVVHKKNRMAALSMTSVFTLFVYFFNFCPLIIVSLSRFPFVCHPGPTVGSFAAHHSFLLPRTIFFYETNLVFSRSSQLAASSFFRFLSFQDYSIADRLYLTRHFEVLFSYILSPSIIPAELVLGQDETRYHPWHFGCWSGHSSEAPHQTLCCSFLRKHHCFGSLRRV